MTNRPAETPTSNSSVGCDQNDWATKLKDIEFDELNTVRTLATGYNSSVSLVSLDRYPGAMFALKTITAEDDPDDKEDQENEEDMLRKAQCAFVPELYRTFRDDKGLHLLMEFLPGGEVGDLGRLSENAAKFYFGCLVEAIDHLHKRNIVHNDVKTMNLVIDAHGYAKLIDFGFAMQLEEGQKAYEDTSGTCEFLPPEVAGPILNGDLYGDAVRDKACDLWPMGILLYEILAEISPFNPDVVEEEDVVLRNIMAGIESLQFPSEHIPEAAEDLIRSLCRHEPGARLGYDGIDKIRAHRWFNGFDWSKLRDRKLTPPMVPEIKSVEEMMQNFTPGVDETG